MPDILHRVGINSKPEQVFNALTTTDGLSNWWTSQLSGDPATAGGTIDFRFCKMLVTEAVPGQLVRWRCVDGPPEWMDTEVTFALDYKRDQTFILFTHAKWKEPVEFMHHCSTKWGTFLLSLRDRVEKSAGHPLPHDLKIYFNE